MKRHKKARVGDVIAIPLKAGQFIHAIILEDCGLEISNVISPSIEFTEQTFNLGEKIYAYAFDTAIKSGLWPVVGNVAEPTWTGIESTISRTNLENKPGGEQTWTCIESTISYTHHRHSPIARR